MTVTSIDLAVMAKFAREKLKIDRVAILRDVGNDYSMGLADYFLTGKLQGLSTKTAAGTSDYILYTFQLIDARTSVIV